MKNRVGCAGSQAHLAVPKRERNGARLVIEISSGSAVGYQIADWGEFSPEWLPQKRSPSPFQCTIRRSGRFRDAKLRV